MQVTEDVCIAKPLTAPPIVNHTFSHPFSAPGSFYDNIPSPPLYHTLKLPLIIAPAITVSIYVNKTKITTIK